jgi:GAF domain-containing protein
MAHEPLHPTFDFSNKAQGYTQLASSLASLLDGERNLVANLANTAALIYHALPDLNWAGFYLMGPRAQGHAPAGADAQELILGPFQGKTACVRIAIGKGVCGTAAATRETQLVRDVHAFPGHIACDSASNSEIVIPMIFAGGPRHGELLGVLDLDSPLLGRFDEEDQRGLETLIKIVMQSIE